MSARTGSVKERRRPFRVLRRLANSLIANSAASSVVHSNGQAVRAQRIARDWYGLDQLALPLGPLTRREALAVCEDVLQAVNAAVVHQFRMPHEVLGHLIACQTDAYRARFEATRRGAREMPADVKAALAKYQNAAGNLQRALGRHA